MFGTKKLSSYELDRLNVLGDMISAILITGRSELSHLARGVSAENQFASRVKRFKRWLLNVHTSYEVYYGSFAQQLLEVLSSKGTLIFSIDGSVVGKGCMALMLSVIYKSKAVPVIWQVYKAKKGHLSQSTHRQLLYRLSKIIPSSCRVVIVGDGEFDGCDFQSDILSHNWDYVLRTGAQVQIEEYEGEVFKVGNVVLESGSDLFFEDVRFTKKRYGPVNLLIWHGDQYEDSIFLVTNLDFNLEIQQFYIKRFKIEPFFRDQKSKGFHIQRSGLRDPRRIEKLLIATCLAYVLSIMASTKASKSKFYDRTARTDGDFLSLFQLGKIFIEVLVDLRQWRTFSWLKDLD